jgi:hypothetical protein
MKLENFKILHEDEKSYHLGHPNGKKLIVEKEKLHPKAHEAIQTLACGGKVQKFADGSTEGPIESYQEDQPKAIAPGVNINYEQNPIASYGSPVKVGTEIGEYNPETHRINREPFKGYETPLPDFLKHYEEPKTNVSTEPQDQTSVDVNEFNPDNQSQNVTPQNQPQGQYQNLYPSMSKAYEAQKGAIYGMGEIGRKQGEEEAGIWQGVQQENTQKPSIEDIQNNWNQSHLEAQKAFAEKRLDPNRYFHEMSTAGKISTSIGLILGGMGAGLTHGPNMAMQIMNNAIDRDIEAQKNDQAKAHTLWSMNRAKYQDDMAATIASKSQMLNAAKFKLLESAANAKSGMAKYQAQLQAAGIDQQQAQFGAMMGLNAGLHLRAGTGTEEEFNQNMMAASQFAPEMQKDAQAKYIPGVGVAKIPVTEDNRKGLLKLSQYENLLLEADKFQKEMGGEPAISPQNRGRAKVLANSLVLMGNDVTGLNRMTGVEHNDLNDMAGDIGQMNLGGVRAKLHELLKITRMKRAGEMQTLGVTPFRGIQTNAPSQGGYTTPQEAPIPKEGDIYGNGNQKIIFKGGKWSHYNG